MKSSVQLMSGSRESSPRCHSLKTPIKKFLYTELKSIFLNKRNILNKNDLKRNNQQYILKVAADDIGINNSNDSIDESNDDDLNYYSILNIAPNANSRQIKEAYYKIMKDYHPDISNDEDATDFCIFLNEIYETLMDDEKRAVYDEIYGFSTNALNPFLDKSYPADHVFVDEFTCIGCQNCIGTCSKTFGLEDEHGRARVYRQRASSTELIQEAIDTCPVDCIHWVTAPQLTLLENAMAKIERIPAYILNMGLGHRNVFHEAYNAFEKQQAEIRTKMNKEKAEDWMVEIGWVPSSHNSNNTDTEDNHSNNNVNKANVMAQAAATARKWRDYQRSKKDCLALPEFKFED